MFCTAILVQLSSPSSKILPLHSIVCVPATATQLHVTVSPGQGHPLGISQTKFESRAVLAAEPKYQVKMYIHTVAS